jgi:murein DD-endopeptidase MepM/ murein hydrolase activator NlpD
MFICMLRKKLLYLGLSISMLAGMGISISSPAHAVERGEWCDRFIESNPKGDISFRRGELSYFACSSTALIFQNDGNLVLYKNNGGKSGWVPIWATGTDDWTNKDPNRRGHLIKVQPDGNVVLYNAIGYPIWATKTFNNPGARFAIQRDGNMVVYTGRIPGTPIWASGTNGGTTRTFVASQEYLSQWQSPGNSVSANDSYLPFDRGTTLKVTQGHDTWISHGRLGGYPASTYAVDFGTGGRQNIGARAVRAGKVLSANYGSVNNANNLGFGNLVKIQYRDGRIAYYAHLASISVTAGQEVAGGQLIGVIGTTGMSTGIHLHYEERNAEFNGSSQPISFKEGNFNFPSVQDESRGFNVTSNNADGRR